MQAVHEMKELLFEELETAVRTTEALIAQINPDHWDYRPRDNMRTLWELAEHLVAIPYVDLLIVQEHSQEEVRRAEAEIGGSRTAEELNGSMKKGFQELKAYMNGLDDEAFLHRKTKPFYLEQGTAQAKWLIEIVTHAHHHRAQLFNYMKELGYGVSMFNLY